MKYTLLAIIACFLFAVPAHAQDSYSIKGITLDTASKAPLTTTVTVLNAKDSILVKYTHAGSDGSFEITDLPAGNFSVWITYPEYADYVENFTLDANHKTQNLGKLYLTLKAALLNEVIIKSKVAAIKIKGDTTIYNARAFVIQPNAKVEDLLKQLPGIQIDRNGKITAQGETVPKVLVDGEEFFGDDPVLVTRNLRADMVDKVLLYDKKSDQAAFTGIDDGKKTKVIDIQLKEDKKTGIFGKVSAGVGNKGFYEAQGIFNRFKAKEKFSVYGTAANDGKIGLGYSDVSRLGSGDNQISDESGVPTFSRYDALDEGTFYGNGMPVAQSGGAHYDGKWDGDKQSINTNYKIGALTINTDGTTTQQRNLSNVVLNTNSETHGYSKQFRQKLDGVYQKTLSPTANLKIGAGAILRNSENDNNNRSETFDETGKLLNRQITHNTNKSDGREFNVSMFFTKKFKKAGRTFSWFMSENYIKNTDNAYQNSSVYLQASAKDTLINQYKPSTSISSVLNSNITFSEPLSKKFSIIFNYGLGLNNSISDKESYNQSTSGNYDILDRGFSNDYTYNQLTNQVGAILNYVNAKTTLNFGTKASAVRFKQIDEFTKDIYKRNFINWLPQLRYQYRFSTSSSLNINYSGRNIQPSIFQIQPIRSNADATNITIGNPDLKPSFSHSFGFNYRSRKALTNSNLSVSGNYSFTANQIVTNAVTDITTGRSVTQFVNLNGKSPYYYYAYIEKSRNFNKIDVYTSLTLDASGNNSYNYINGALNQTTNRSYMARLSVSRNKAKKYELSLAGGPTYTFSEFLLPDKNNNNAAGSSMRAYVNLYLPFSFQIMTDITYYHQAATASLPALDVTNWNASLNRSFLKEDKLKLSISGNNLLNQNENYRSSYSGTISQSNYNTIRRYFLVSLSWDFTKFGTLTEKK